MPPWHWIVHLQRYCELSITFNLFLRSSNFSLFFRFFSTNIPACARALRPPHYRHACAALTHTHIPPTTNPYPHPPTPPTLPRSLFRATSPLPISSSSPTHFQQPSPFPSKPPPPRRPIPSLSLSISVRDCLPLPSHPLFLSTISTLRSCRAFFVPCFRRL